MLARVNANDDPFFGTATCDDEAIKGNNLGGNACGEGASRDYTFVAGKTFVVKPLCQRSCVDTYVAVARLLL
jgi:hypothetical protein